MAHAYPGTALYDQGMKEGFLAGEAITDDMGHQLPHLQYPDLSREYMVESVNRFYDEYYFRPRVAWRIVRERCGIRTSANACSTKRWTS